VYYAACEKGQPEKCVTKGEKRIQNQDVVRETAVVPRRNRETTAIVVCPRIGRMGRGRGANQTGLAITHRRTWHKKEEKGW